MLMERFRIKASDELLTELEGRAKAAYGHLSKIREALVREAQGYVFIERSS